MEGISADSVLPYVWKGVESMTRGEEQADEKIRKWLGEVFPPERIKCGEDYCEIRIKQDGELKELIKEQHRNE